MSASQKVFGAESNVIDFIVKDASENLSTVLVSSGFYTFESGGRDIEPARFEHHWNHRQPRCHIVPGCVSRLPQPRMCGQCAVVTAKAFELARQQREMHRFVGGDREKIGNELFAHFLTESTCHIERKVDGDKFDMREAVPQSDSRAFGAVLSALRHSIRR